MGDDHIEAVKEWPVPFSNKDPRIVEPLYRVTGKKSFVREFEQQEALEGLHGDFISPLVLTVSLCRTRMR